MKTERVQYTAEFTVDSSFGVPGAITISNKHQKEFFLESMAVEGFACGPVHFPCDSWVQSKKDHPGKRIFFSNQVLTNYIFSYAQQFLLGVFFGLIFMRMPIHTDPHLKLLIIDCSLN